VALSAEESDQWNAWIEGHLVREWNEHIHPEIDGVVEATADALAELRAENQKLRLELAELRGERRGMREDRRTDHVVHVPREAWKHDVAH
jgi:hypothetical protein